MKPEKPQTDTNGDHIDSGRKERAFYATLGVVVFLFIGSGWWKDSPTQAIGDIIQLAMVYIGGIAIHDSVRTYKKAPSILDPEKVKELQQRYADK